MKLALLTRSLGISVLALGVLLNVMPQYAFAGPQTNQVKIACELKSDFQKLAALKAGSTPTSQQLSSINSSVQRIILALTFSYAQQAGIGAVLPTKKPSHTRPGSSTAINQVRLQFLSFENRTGSDLGKSLTVVQKAAAQALHKLTFAC